jgi:DNA-binding FadR family transcriptional regulator
MTAARDDAVAFGLADVEFHDAVMLMSGNRLGRQLVNRIHDKARATERYHGTVTAPLVETTLAEHQRVLDAVATGDPAAAATAMHTHITGSWDRRRPRREPGD